MKGRLVASLLVVVAVTGASIGWLAAGARPRLGLDLEGGISAILTPVGAPGQEIDTGVLDQTIEVIRSRVDSLGVAEAEIARQGTDILVQLPGLQDIDRAREIIGRTAKLTFRPVEAVILPTDPAYDETPPCTQLAEQQLPDDQPGVLCGSTTAPDGTPIERPTKYRVGPAALDGSRIDDAFPRPGTGVVQDPSGRSVAQWEVSLILDSEGAQKFADITAELACQRDAGQPGLLAIVLDQVVESAPAMNPDVQCGVGIRGGQAVITVGGGEQAARDLALVLRTGALPVTLQPSTFETVSPTLGRESLRAGLLAGAVGLVLVALYLVVFYRWLGLVAIGALVVFGAVTTALITLLGEVGFTLTLAGVAGVVVSVGITADSSIIYFERLRDEVSTGRTVRTATQRAFRSAFRTNLTGNTVTLAAAAILYVLAVGPVRGFAFTLGLANILDLLILYGYTRAAVILLGRTRLLSRRALRAEVAPAPAGGAR